MDNELVKDAKVQFIETGRINQKIVSKEISMSWYKCKLQNLYPNSQIKSCGSSSDHYFEDQFVKFIDSIIKDSYQYILVNNELVKCSSRLWDSNLEKIDSLDDALIGTNAGYISFKSKQTSIVSLSEHYLDALSQYYSIGFQIKEDDQNKGILTLFTQIKPNEYEIAKIVEFLHNYEYQKNKAVGKATAVETKHQLGDFLSAPDDYVEEISRQIEKMIANPLPKLVIGGVGSGKTSICTYMSLQLGMNPVIVDLVSLPNFIQKQTLKSCLFQNETVIIEGVYRANLDTIMLLTVYSDSILSNFQNSKYSDFKCKNIILSTLTDECILDFTSESVNKLYTQLLDKFKLNSLKLKNYHDFTNEDLNILELIIKKRACIVSETEKKQLLNLAKGMSFHQVVSLINSLAIYDQSSDKFRLNAHKLTPKIKFESLEAHEKDYILTVYNQLDCNVQLTAEALEIGRSTLYRKLEKYHDKPVSK